ncbi:MAG: permease [Gracilibacter sp. BRH_c7a]|nr:MAG: permease [Gracilibacter sp. BRH_c7a]
MKRSKKRWLFIILLALLSIFFLFKVRSIISPFIVGIVLAYLLSPVVSWLEKQGLNRKAAVTVIFIWIIVLLSLTLFFLLPKLYLELGKLTSILPQKIQVIYEYADHAKNRYSQAGLPSEVTKLIEDQLKDGQNFLIKWLESLIDRLPDIIVSLGLLIISPILAIYFMLDWKRINEGVLQLVPQKVRGQWHKFLQEVDYIIQRYIQGNVIVSIIVGLLIGFGVKLIGMDYAFIIGVICGITNLIPYFGPILGGVPSVLLALGISPSMALKVALIIFIVQQIEGNIINPKLMSGKVGLHPLWVVFALLAGGELGGLLGMFLAIPLAAVIRIIIRDVYNHLVAPKALDES